MPASTSTSFRSPPTTTSSASESPPESPTILTPAQTPATLAMTTNGKAYGENGIAADSTQPSDTKHALPNVSDLPPLPPSANTTPLVQSAPHFVARSLASPRTDGNGAFTSAAQPTYTGYRDRPSTPRNEKNGYPERSSQDGPYLGPEGKKEHHEHASPFRNYDARYPLSSAANGNASYSAVPSSPKKHFYDSVPFWLALYFFFNLGLTLFNKIVLVSFPFPYTLTGLHALSGCAGTYIALEQGAFTPARLTQKENLILAAFSVLYTINIAVSNISLQLVTVPFHQVVRAATPLFTIFITAAFLRVKFSMRKLVSLLPVVAGVGFATYGDYYFTAWGLVLTLLGTFLAALKTVVTNVIQTGGGGRLKLHPLDLLMRMSPLAFVQCVFYGWYTGELERVRRYGATQMTRTKAVALLINGIIACGLNIVSFTANKKAGALTMTVSANCKQVLTIALAVILFNLHITITNGIGIFLTLCGGACYAYVEYSEKKKKQLGSAKVLGS